MNEKIIENYISSESAAKYLNVKIVTLRKWIKEGTIPAHKIGRQWKFKVSELDAWIKSGDSAKMKLNKSVEQEK